jgi:peptidoglycan hydrolase-like amidase
VNSQTSGNKTEKSHNADESEDTYLVPKNELYYNNKAFNRKCWISTPQLAKIIAEYVQEFIYVKNKHNTENSMKWTEDFKHMHLKPE